MKKTVLFVLLIWGIQAIAIAQDYENIPEHLANSFVYEGIRYHRLSDSTVEVGYHLADYSFTDVIEDENRIFLRGDIIIPSTVSDGEREYTVVAISSQAFYANIFNSVTLPPTIKSIGNQSFTCCIYLSSVSLSDGIESIGENAFTACFSLPVINIPQTVTYMGRYAFDGCFGLEKITLSPNMTTINEGTFIGCHKLKQVSIPDKVTAIMSKAFYHCDSLRHIDLPSGITSIESSAFEGCPYLTEIVLPPGLEEIGERAFYNCYRLQNVYFPSSLRYIGDGAFGVVQYDYHKSYKDYCACNKNYQFSDDGNVPLEIGKRAFEYQYADSIVLPKNIYKIGEEAFRGCYSDYLSIPNGIRNIGYKAFCFNRVDTVVSYLDDLSVYNSGTSPSLFLQGFTRYWKLYVPDILVDMYKNNIEWQSFEIIPLTDYSPDDLKPGYEYTDTGIQRVNNNSNSVNEVTRYDLSGRRIDSPKRGINIIETSSGKRRKVMVK